MSINPITITIQDDSRYADVAYFIDRADVLTDIENLRKKWKINIPLTPEKNKIWWLFPWTSTKRQMQKYAATITPLERKVSNLNQLWKMKIDKRDKLLKEYQKAEEILPSGKFRADISRLRKKYKRPPNFDRVIGNAVLYGIVSDKEYVTCEIGLSDPKAESSPVLEDIELTITFYPLATAEDIEKLFRDKSEALIKEYRKYFAIEKIYDPRAGSNIRRDRDWYWLKKNGWSYGRIMNKANKTYRGITREVIIKAIQRYEGKITV